MPLLYRKVAALLPIQMSCYVMIPTNKHGNLVWIHVHGSVKMLIELSIEKTGRLANLNIVQWIIVYTLN